MRIWELHSLQMAPSILTTPGGEANVEGLVLTEKAYLLAVRDFRPSELVEMVVEQGPRGAAVALVAHYMARGDGAGRVLAMGRGNTPGPTLRRSDEPVEPAVGADRTLIHR